MKPFTHKEYKIVEKIYNDYKYMQSILTQDSPETDWERYHTIECMYHEALANLIG